MAKRKRRYYDSYTCVKAQQQVARQKSEVVHNWEIDDIIINTKDNLVNKKKRSRVGFVEVKKVR